MGWSRSTAWSDSETGTQSRISSLSTLSPEDPLLTRSPGQAATEQVSGVTWLCGCWTVARELQGWDPTGQSVCPSHMPGKSGEAAGVAPHTSVKQEQGNSPPCQCSTNDRMILFQGKKSKRRRTNLRERKGSMGPER